MQAPFSAFKPSSRRKKLDFTFDNSINRYNAANKPQIVKEHFFQAEGQPVEKITTTAPPQTAPLERELTALQQQLANFEDWLDNTQFGKAVVKIFGKRQERLEIKKVMMAKRFESRKEKGKKSAKTMYEVERLLLEASSLSSWLGAITKSVTSTMISTITYDLIYKPVFSWWLGKGIKSAWTFSIDKILGKQKAGKLAGVSLQELAGRLEELIIKDKDGFGVRSGNITLQKVREAFVGGTEFSLKLHLLPYLLSHLPSIGSIINPAEINQLFISLNMAMGSKHSVKSTIDRIKEARSPIEKVGILLTASASGLLYGFARKVSPTLFDGPMGGANLAVMIDTGFNQLLSGASEIIGASKGEFHESKGTKWLHTIQAGIAGYNAGHSVISLGNMLTSVIETGSINPVAHLKTEEQLIKLVEEAPQYLFGKGGWVFGKILNAENQLHQKMMGVFTKAGRSSSASAQEQSSQESSQETPPMVLEINGYTYMIQTDSNQVLGVVRVSQKGGIALLEKGVFTSLSANPKTAKEKTGSHPEKAGFLPIDNDPENADEDESESTTEFVSEEQVQEIEKIVQAVHDYVIHDPDGWINLRLDLVEGESLEEKFTRLLSGQVDDDAGELLGADIRNLSEEEIERLAGEDRVLEAQFYRDFIQPIQLQAQEAGIPDAVLVQRLTQVFETNMVMNEHSTLCLGEIHQASLYNFLLQPVTTEESQVIPPPTLTFFEQERPAVFRDQNQVHLQIKAGESLLANLRQELPEQAVINIYSGILKGELAIYVQTDQGLTSIISPNIIPANSQLIIRATNEEATSLLDSVSSLQASAEILKKSGYSMPRTPIDVEQELVFTEGVGFRPRTSLDTPFKQTKSDAPLACSFSMQIEGEEEMQLEPATVSPTLEATHLEDQIPATDQNYTVPWYGFNREAVGFRQSTQDGALSIIPLGEVPAGGSVSQLMSRVFVSQEEGAPNTWQVIDQIQKAAQSGNSSSLALVVVDANTGEIVKIVDPQSFTVHPGDLLAILDLEQTLDVPKYDGYLPREPEPYAATETLAYIPTDPQQMHEKEVMTGFVQGLVDERVSGINLSGAVIHYAQEAETDTRSGGLIFTTKAGDEVHYNPVTGELILYTIPPGSTEPLLRSYQPGFIIEHQVQLPPSLTTKVLSMFNEGFSVSNWPQMSEMINQAVTRREILVPDEFYSLYQGLAQSNPEILNTDIHQAWAMAIQQTLANRLSNQSTLSPEELSSFSVPYYQVLKALGLDPAASLSQDGCLLTPMMPASLVRDPEVVANELSVELGDLTFTKTDDPRLVQACVVPEQEIGAATPMLSSLESERLFLVQQPDGRLTPTRQPQPSDNVVEILETSVNPTDQFIFTSQLEYFIEVGSKRISVSPDHPRAQAGRLAINPTTLECFVEVSNPSTVSEADGAGEVDEVSAQQPVGAIEADRVRTLLPIQGCQVDLESLQPSAEHAISSNLLSSTVRALTKATNTEIAHDPSTGLFRLSRDGELVLFSLHPFPDSSNNPTIHLTHEGKLVLFDQSQPGMAPMAINQSGEFESVNPANTVPLSEFLDHYDLSIATQNGSILHRNGDTVFINSQGLAVVLTPEGPTVIGSIFDQATIGSLSQTQSISSLEQFTESFNLREVSSIKPTSQSMALEKQFRAVSNLSFRPVIDARGNIHHDGQLFQPTAFIAINGAPVFFREDDRTYHHLSINGVQQLDLGANQFGSEQEMLSQRALSPLYIQDAEVKVGIGAWQPAVKLTNFADGRLIHKPTGLPLFSDSNGNWYIQTAVGFETIGDPANAVTYGVVQIEEADNSTRPLTLTESRRIIDTENNLPPLDFKQRTVAVLSSVDQSLAKILNTSSFSKFWSGRVADSGNFENLRALLDQAPNNYPPDLLETIVNSEDQGAFANTVGFSSWSIVRAVVNSIRGKELGAGGGGGTIAMQVARSLLLDDRSRNLVRKINEIVLATHLMDEFTPKKIVQLYLETTNYGDGQQLGIEAGAVRLFGVGVDQLSPAQKVMLTVVPQVPGRYNFETFQNAVSWVQRSEVTVDQQLSRGLITPQVAEQIRQEMREMLPSNWELLVGQLNRNIIPPQVAEQAWQRHKQERVIVSAHEQQAMLHSNQVVLLAKNSSISENDNLSQAAERPSGLLASADLYPERVSSETQAEEDTFQPPPPVSETRVPVVFVEQFNHPENGATQREEVNTSFQNFLQGEQELRLQLGLTTESRFNIAEDQTSVAIDGTYSFTVVNEAGIAVGVVYATQSPETNEWSPLSFIAGNQEERITFIDLRQRIAATGAVEYPAEDLGNGLRNLVGKANVMLHQLGGKDVKDAVPPFDSKGAVNTEMLLDQILKPGVVSPYNIAISVDHEGNTQIIYLGDIHKLSGGAHPGLNDQEIHILVLFDESQELSPNQMFSLTQAVNRVIAQIDASADIVDPHEVRGHNNIEPTECFTIFDTTPASPDALVRIYRKTLEPIYPGMENSPAQIEQLIGNILNKEPGTITYSDLIRVGAAIQSPESRAAIAQNPVEQLATSVEEPATATAPPSTLPDEIVVQVVPSTTPEPQYPRSGVVFETDPRENENFTRGWLTIDWYNEIQDRWVVVGKSAEGTPAIVFNPSTNTVGTLREDGTIVRENFNQVVAEKDGTIAYVIPLDLTGVKHNLANTQAESGDSFFVNTDGIIYRKAEGNQDRDARPTVERVGAMVYSPDGTALIAPSKLVAPREGVMLGTGFEEATISAILNAASQESVDPTATELGTDEGSPTIFTEIAESLKAQTSILPIDLRYQNPENLSATLTERGVLNRGISLRTNPQGREVFENTLRAVVEKRGEQMVVWIDFEKAQSRLIESPELSAAIIRDSRSTAVTVRDISNIGGTDYVFFEIPQALGNRTTPMITALTMAEFLRVSEVGGNPFRGLVLGEDAIVAIDPGLEHTIRQNSEAIHESSIVNGLQDNWSELSQTPELMDKTTIRPELQDYAARIIAQKLPLYRAGSQTPPNAFGVFVQSDINHPEEPAQVIADFSLMNTPEGAVPTQSNNNCDFLGPLASTIKPITLMAYLASGGSPTKMIQAGDSIILDGVPVLNHSKGAAKFMTPAEIIRWSNNPGAANLAIEMGRLALARDNIPFDLGLATEIGGQLLIQYMNETGIFEPNQTPGLQTCADGAPTSRMAVPGGGSIESQGGFRILSAFGQGGLHGTNWDLIEFYLAATHKGDVPDLEFILGKATPTGTVLPGAQPDHFEILDRALRQAAITTTGAFRSTNNYVVFGKTGTAQTAGLLSNSYFSGYAREVDRRGRFTGKVVTFSVQVPEANEGEAAILVREMLDEIFRNTPPPVVTP